MAKKPNLPSVVHGHFQKANKLHGYVEKELGEATKHALEIGQELSTAKKAIPHGSWESECKRLFDGSPRTARFYMSFHKDFGKLSKTAGSAVLMLEGTLDGAAKAAKKATKPKPPKPAGGSPPEPDEPIDVDSEPAEDPEIDYGKCPVCAGTKWDDDVDDDVCCSKCRHPHGEPAGDVDEDRINTQRQKTVKTLEAAMRAFDDLQLMKARPEYDDSITACKSLIQVAKGWK